MPFVALQTPSVIMCPQINNNLVLNNNCPCFFDLSFFTLGVLIWMVLAQLISQCYFHILHRSNFFKFQAGLFFLFKNNHKCHLIIFFLSWELLLRITSCHQCLSFQTKLNIVSRTTMICFHFFKINFKENSFSHFAV